MPTKPPDLNMTEEEHQLEQEQMLALQRELELDEDSATGSEKVSIMQLFFNTFFSNKNYNQNWPFLTKDRIFFKFSLFGFEAKMLRRGEFSIFFFVFACTGMLKSSH